MHEIQRRDELSQAKLEPILKVHPNSRGLHVSAIKEISEEQKIKVERGAHTSIRVGANSKVNWRGHA